MCPERYNINCQYCDTCKDFQICGDYATTVAKDCKVVFERIKCVECIACFICNNKNKEE